MGKSAGGEKGRHTESFGLVPGADQELRNLSDEGCRKLRCSVVASWKEGVSERRVGFLVKRICRYKTPDF